MKRLALLQMTGDILNGDRGVIDQDANGESQSAERHHIDGLVEEAQQDHRTQDGQRDGYGYDDGAAPASQKYQDHERRETGGDHSFPDDASDSGPDKDGLIRKRLNLELLWERLLHAG